MIKVLSNQSYYDERTKKFHAIECENISCGPNHCAVTLDMNGKAGNNMYVWGFNNSYQLGIGRRTNLCSPQSPKFSESVPTTSTSSGTVLYDESIVKPHLVANQNDSNDNDGIFMSTLKYVLGKVNNAAPAGYVSSTETNSTMVGSSFYSASSGARYNNYEIPMQLSPGQKIACGPENTIIY